MPARQRSFVCAVSDKGFLARRKKDQTAWPFSDSIYEAVKFVSEQDAVEWLEEKQIYGVELQYHRLPTGVRRS